jgi:hypothetical protein
MHLPSSATISSDRHASAQAVHACAHWMQAAMHSARRSRSIPMVAGVLSSILLMMWLMRLTP